MEFLYHLFPSFLVSIDWYLKGQQHWRRQTLLLLTNTFDGNTMKISNNFLILENNIIQLHAQNYTYIFSTPNSSPALDNPHTLLGFLKTLINISIQIPCVVCGIYLYRWCFNISTASHIFPVWVQPQRQKEWGRLWSLMWSWWFSH
jgi:hypothetical protein